VASRLVTALRGAEDRAAPALRDLALRLKDNAQLESGRRRIAWVVIALLLVLGPVLFNLARESHIEASVEVYPADVGPYRAVRDPGYYSSLLTDPELVRQMRLNAGARYTEWRNATFRPTPRGTLTLTLGAGSRTRAQRLVNALAAQIAGATQRQLVSQVGQEVATLRAEAGHSARGTAGRRVHRIRLRRLERLAAKPTPRVVLASASPPRATGWADKVADVFPGGRPRRADPVAAGLAGLLVAATLWAIGLVLVPPVRVSGAGRPARDLSVFGFDLRRLARAPREALVGWRGVAWLGAVAVLPILMLRSIIANGVNVPFWDEWSMVGLFQAQHNGTLGLHDFWTQANEHRPLFPRAINFLLAQGTSWDVRAENYVNFAVALLTFVVLMIVLRRVLDGVPFVAASVVASVIFFSPVQWENWLWGFELEYFICALAAVGTMYALTFVMEERSVRTGMVIAAACAVLGSFSFANGLLLWPVGLVLLLLRGRPWRLWVVLSVLTWFVYLNGWQSFPGPSRSLFLERPLEYIQFVCLYFGRWFAVGRTTGTLAGAILILGFLVGAAYVVRHRRDAELVHRATFWLGLGLFGLTTAVVTGVSRMGFGLLAASVPRYFGFSGLFAISTMALLFAIVRSEQIAGRKLTVRMRHAAVAAVALPLLLAALVNVRAAFPLMEKWRVDRSADAACVHAVQASTDACLQRPNVARPSLQFDRIQFLRSQGLAGF
jgi:hypothetical protein